MPDPIELAERLRRLEALDPLLATLADYVALAAPRPSARELADFVAPLTQAGSEPGVSEKR